MHPPFLFALGLANPVLIYGLGAASVPLIIHLLNRRKFREVPWAAMRFLAAAVKKNSRRVRIEHWLLLAVRTLIIVLVVTAMAKPFLEGFGAGPRIVGSRTHHVVVLDGSLSMAFDDAGATRFERAKALAAQLVRDARAGDPVSLVLFGDPPRVVIGAPSPNRDEVLKELGEVTATHGGTDLTAGFNAIDRVLDASDITQKEVIVITDLQAASWKRSEGSADEGLRRAVAKLEARRARSVVIDLGKAGGENRAVIGLSLDTPVVTVGTPAAVRAVLKNFGPSRKEGVAVRLVVDGGLGPEQPVDLAVGEDQEVAFNHTFTSPGDHVVEVSIGDDPLKPDNQRRLAVPVKEHVNVLLVDGHFKSEPFQAETDYLAAALSPQSDSEGATSAIKADVIPEGQLAGRELSEYDAVALCNVAQFTEPEVAALEDFLKQGGGVIVFGGDQVVPDNYNRLLFRDGQGLLPVSIGPAVGDASQKNTAFGFNALGFRHPLIDEFGGESDPVTAGLTSTKTWRFHKLVIPPGSEARVALAFDNGDPAVVEGPRFRGHVIVVATSADAGWTTWPLHPSFPPVMEQIVQLAASGKSAERNVRVGQPLDLTLPLSGLTAPVSIIGPGNKTVASKLQAAGGVSRLHFEETEFSGSYLAKFGPPLASEAAFAANPPAAESDPAKLDQASLKESVPGWTFDYMTNWKELTGNAASVSRRGELHRGLLYALLAFLLIESLMAWRFGHHASAFENLDGPPRRLREPSP